MFKNSLNLFKIRSKFLKNPFFEFQEFLKSETSKRFASNSNKASFFAFFRSVLFAFVTLLLINTWMKSSLESKWMETLRPHQLLERGHNFGLSGPWAAFSSAFKLIGGSHSTPTTMVASKIGLSVLLLEVFLLRDYLAEAFQTCPSICTCKWKNGEYFYVKFIQLSNFK